MLSKYSSIYAYLFKRKKKRLFLFVPSDQAMNRTFYSFLLVTSENEDYESVY